MPVQSTSPAVAATEAFGPSVRGADAPPGFEIAACPSVACSLLATSRFVSNLPDQSRSPTRRPGSANPLRGWLELRPNWSTFVFFWRPFPSLCARAAHVRSALRELVWHPSDELVDASSPVARVGRFPAPHRALAGSVHALSGVFAFSGIRLCSCCHY